MFLDHDYLMCLKDLYNNNHTVLIRISDTIYWYIKFNS